MANPQEYNYQGMDKKGQKVQGKLSAATEGEVRMALRKLGVRPTKIVESSKDLANQDVGDLLKKAFGMKTQSGDSGVPLKVLIGFTRQLQVLITSGIPLVQAIDILREGVNHPGFEKILGQIHEQVSGGSYLWECMARYPKAFPKIYTSLVRAGESAGAIDVALDRLAIYLEKADKLRSMLKGAMFYPVGVIVVGVGVIFIMLTFVIPKFKDMLISNGQELPGPTAFVIDLSNFLVQYFPHIIGTLFVSVFLITRFLKTKEGERMFHYTLLKLPLFGTLVQKGATAKFSRTMQTLLASGVNLIDALDICKSTVGNLVFEEKLGSVRGEIEKGLTLGATMYKINLFPKMANQMISVGESAGNLDVMLNKIAEYYEDEVEKLTSGMTKLIEPFLLVFLGGAVGGILIAMYLPIFQLAGGV